MLVFGGGDQNVRLFVWKITILHCLSVLDTLCCFVEFATISDIIKSTKLQDQKPKTVLCAINETDCTTHLYVFLYWVLIIMLEIWYSFNCCADRDVFNIVVLQFSYITSRCQLNPRQIFKSFLLLTLLKCLLSQCISLKQQWQINNINRNTDLINFQWLIEVHAQTNPLVLLWKETLAAVTWTIFLQPNWNNSDYYGVQK